MNISIKLLPRKDYKTKEGNIPLNLQILKKEGQKWQKKTGATGINICENDFDFKNLKAKPKHFDANIINGLILKMNNRINEVLYEINVKEISLTIEQIAVYVLEGTKRDNISLETNFYSWAFSKISQFEGKYTKEVIRQCKGEITKLQKFRKELSFKDINYQFISEYEHYMYNTLQNCTNTIYQKTFKKLKYLLNIAINEGIIEKNPFNEIKFKKDVPIKRYLTFEELQSLEKLYKTNELENSMKHTLQFYLFSCYTGLRYGEYSILTKDMIDINNKIIRVLQPKSKVRPVKIVPLLDRAVEILKDSGFDEGNNNFIKVLTNQSFNRNLKIIAAMIGLKKSLTHHTARHTFATLLLNKGVPLEIVSDLMGHNSVKLTKEVYADFLETTLIDEMRKFELKLNNREKNKY